MLSELYPEIFQIAALRYRCQKITNDLDFADLYMSFMDIDSSYSRNDCYRKDQDLIICSADPDRFTDDFANKFQNRFEPILLTHNDRFIFEKEVQDRVAALHGALYTTCWSHNDSKYSAWLNTHNELKNTDERQFIYDFYNTYGNKKKKYVEYSEEQFSLYSEKCDQYRVMFNEVFITKLLSV